MASDVHFEEEKGVFQSWKIREGTTVRAAAILLVYKTNDGVKQVKTNSAGVVQSLAKLNAGDELTQGQLLVQLRQCDHPVVMKDLCADCGEDLRQKHGLPGERAVPTHARVAMIHHIPELQITPEEAKDYGAADEKNLLRQRKLVLLVDLDQTLIHTTNEDVNPKTKDVFHFQLYGSASPWYHTRLRPHTRHFLESASKLFELHICTFGARLYAHTVAKILDPDGKLFGQRILSREECFDANLKIANLKALFPCGDRLVCIIDDREDVWNYAPNVVHVKPYRFFKHTGDINAPPGFSKNGQTKEPVAYEAFKEPKPSTDAESTNQESSDTNMDNIAMPDTAETPEKKQLDSTPTASEPEPEPIEEDVDDYLYHLEDILTRIHTAFYQMYEQMGNDERPPDLKSVVPYVKNKVLKNCNIVFSGVVPMNVPVETSSIYKAAVTFGANVQKDVVLPYHPKYRSSTATTHVVAAKWGTAKVNQARKAGSMIKIITPQWLWCCVERWEREDERLFLLASADSSTSESRRHERRHGKKDDGTDIQMDAQSSTVAVPNADELFGNSSSSEPLDLAAGGDAIDLDYEPNMKKPKILYDDGDHVSLSSSSSRSSEDTKSTPDENDDDEELAEALERELE